MGSAADVPSLRKRQRAPRAPAIEPLTEADGDADPVATNGEGVTASELAIASGNGHVDGPPPLAPVIALRRVTKVYSTGFTEVRALDGIDLIIERGDYVAIMGSSGSGKSTLMNIIGCSTALVGALPARRHRHRGPRRRRARPTSATARSASSSRASTSSPARPRSDNVELPLVYAGVGGSRRRERARWRRSTPSAWLIA